ncbi:MAG: 23S ribosomal RNA methyltransferase Erm [Ardenticatenaceae bacterium]|nr:23S ribosomal RNA methyltransferase Erm [Ardenticatenaceae bacterium]
MSDSRKNRQQKDFAQNFLIHAKTVRQLVGKAGFSAEDLVLEIGPGEGIITREVAKRAGRVTAIEIDHQLAANLRKSLAKIPNVEIKNGDFLKTSLPTKPFNIFSNIPFNITAPIMLKLWRSNHPPHDAYFIMQREAADKFIGQNASTESSILFQPWFTFENLANINRFEFRPVPRVDATLLHMQKRVSPQLEPHHKDLYYKFVTYGFRRWRKNLKIGYKNVFTHNQWKRLAKDGRFPSEALPSHLSLEQWLHLYRYFVTGVAEEKKRVILNFHT